MRATTEITPDGWVTTRRDDGVVVRLHVDVNDQGQAVVTEVRVEAADVTTDILRSIQPGRAAAALMLALGGPQPKSRKRKRLGRPDGSDQFYRNVADAYRAAAAETSRAIVTLAEENDVPAETVRRWVKEARRRGHLAAGKRGRAS